MFRKGVISLSWIHKVNRFSNSEPMSITLSIKNNVYNRGESVVGTITIIGGSKKQKAFGVLIHLMTEKNGEASVSHGNYKVFDSFVIHPNEKITFPFIIELPEEGPFISTSENVFLMTHVVKWLSIGTRHKQYLLIKE